MLLYGVKGFEYQQTQPFYQAEKLSDFLSVMYAEDLDGKNIGYGFLVKGSKTYEKTCPKGKGAHRNPEEVQEKGSEAKYHLDKDPVIFKTVSCKPVKEFPQTVFDLKFYRNNYYITKNRFTSTSERDSSHLFGYSTIVIDIDDHSHVKRGEGEKRLERVNELFYALNDFVFSQPEFPSPNGVVYTGRGLQLWWKVKPVTSKNHSKFYQTVTEYLIEGINGFLSSTERLKCFKIDHAASKNEAGLVRLPGTYNVQAGFYGDFFLLHDDSIDIYEESIQINQAQKKKRAKTHNIKYDDPLLLAKKREEKLIRLLKYRHANDPERTDTRDLFLFFIFNAFMTATGDEKISFEHTFSFNEWFAHPMPENEVRSYMKTSLRKGGYRCSNTKMIAMLDISADEQGAIGLQSSRKKKRTGTAKDKKERDAKILQFCDDGVFTEKEIAQKAGCSVATVMRVLKINKRITKKQTVHNKFLSSFKAGRPVKGLKKKYGDCISESGIYYIKKKAENWKSAMHEKIDELRERKRKNCLSATDTCNSSFVSFPISDISDDRNKYQTCYIQASSG